MKKRSRKKKNCAKKNCTDDCAAYAEIVSWEMLSKTTMLTHPHSTATLSITTDVSDIAIGSVLHQQINSSLQPLALYSCKLSPTETWYMTFDRKLLAVFDSIRHFHNLIEGQRSWCILTTSLVFQYTTVTKLFCLEQPGLTKAAVHLLVHPGPLLCLSSACPLSAMSKPMSSPTHYQKNHDKRIKAKGC